MIAATFDVLICLLIVAVALAAVAGRDLFGAVAFFIVYGLLVAVAWTRLGAVDVALAEAAIGAGLTGLLLVGTTARLARLKATEAAPLPVGRRALAGLACLVFSLAVAYAALTLDPAGAGLTPLVAENLAAAGSDNPVTAVLLNFRGYDTLLESIVLLAALIGVWSLAEDRHWGGIPGLRQHARPDGVLASFGRLLPPVGLLIGIYLVWTGSDHPGGAFQGGTVLAAAWLLTAMAGLTDAPRVTQRGLRLALVAGPAVFLAIGAAGALAGSFLWLPPSQAKALILVIETALAASIAATLALLVLGPPGREAR